MARTGRPSIYSQEVSDEICARLAAGESLSKICRDPLMPCIASITMWLSTNKYPEFTASYARAREIQAEVMLEEILAISDDSSNDTYIDDEGKTRVDHDVIARSKLKVDTRKWIMARMSPRKYGDQIPPQMRVDITNYYNDTDVAALQRYANMVIEHQPTKPIEED